MLKRVEDLSPNARDLASVALEYMDSRWDPEVALLRYAEPRPGDGAARTGRPAVVAPRHAVRGTAWYALALLMRDDPGDRDRAAVALETVLDHQYDAPGAPYHGTWRLFHRSEEPARPEEAAGWAGYDPNWRQFIGLALAILLDEYSSLLPIGLAARVDRAIMRAVQGEIDEARLRPTYTNIALMRAALDRWAGVRYGQQAWVEQSDRWVQEIHGLFRAHEAYPEYNSPTYYGVDLYALGFWRAYAPSGRMAELGREMERALWRDVAALYHAPLRNLCGPYTRAYAMDIRTFPTGVGQAIWIALGRRLAPHPEPGSPDARHNEMFPAIMFPAVGVEIPPDALPALRAFPGEHTFERVVSDEPPLAVSAWLSEDVMMGGADSGGTRRAGGQFHPVTMHWLARDGDVCWMRMCAGEGVDAEVRPRTMRIRCSGDPAFELDAPDSSAEERALELSRTRWELPGLRVAVETDATDHVAERAGDTARITYPGATRFVLRV